MVRRPLVTLALLAAAGAALAGAPAHADDYFRGQDRANEIRMREGRSRTTEQRLAIAGVLGASALAAGVGLWFHLDSDEAARAVSASGEPTGKSWTPDLQDAYDRAGRSGTWAIVGYVTSAVLLGAGTYLVWSTQPGEHEVVVAPVRRGGAPVVAPVAGGALVGGEWRW